MNLKNNSQTIFEKASQLLKSPDLHLLGSQDNNPRLVDVFGVETKFFYIASKTTLNNELIVQEYGIGYIYQKDNEFFLKRDHPFVYSTPSSSPQSCSSGPTDLFIDNSNSQLTVLSTLPLYYLENYFDSHCVIASSSPFLPQPVVLSEFSLLGRLDSNVQNLSFSTLCQNKNFIDELMSLISKYSKQLSLKTSKLDVKKLSTGSVQLNPSSSKDQSKRGSIVYDEKDDLIKYYDGVKWRSLAWQYDEEV